MPPVTRRRFLASATGAAIAFGNSVAQQSEAFEAPNRSTDSMVFPEKDWEISPPRRQGIDPQAMAKAVAHLEKNAGRDGVNQLLIIRNGYLVHHGPKIDTVHGVWSCTKSFTSTVLGLLIDDGKCTLDTLACEFEPRLKKSYPKVTLRHFTTMTSGYRAVGDEPKGGYTHGPSDTPFVPSDTPLFPPGTHFAYWDSAMNMFGRVLTRIAGESMKSLFMRRIAEPIGMDSAAWTWGTDGDIDGVPINGGSGNRGKHVQISARQIARFGMLFLNGGRWKDVPLISARWIAQASSVQVAADLPLGHRESGIDGRGCYGFNWWVNGRKPDGQRKWPAAPEHTFAALGYNNNVVFVVPEWNMVVVRLGLDAADRVLGDGIWSGFFRLLGAGID